MDFEVGFVVDLDVDLVPALDAALDDAAGGSTATASISKSAPSRARPEIASVVLAGRFWSER
jgi:hypothetical protein